MLLRSFVGTTLQLPFWIMLSPSAWTAYIQRIDATLRATFAIAELHWPQWRNRRVWILLLQLWLMWVLATWTAALLGTLGIFGLSIDTISLPLQISGLAGMYLAVTTGVAAGVAVAFGGAVIAGGAAALATVVNRIVGSGPAESDPTLALGAAFGFTILATARLPGPPRTCGLIRRLAGILLGIPATAVAYLVSIGLCAALVATLAGLVYGAGVAATTRPSSQLLAFLAMAISMSTEKFLPILGTLLGVEPEESVLMALVIGVFIAVPAVMAERLAGRWAGALAGPVVLCIGAFAAGSPSIGAAVFLGMAFGVWWSLPTRRRNRPSGTSTDAK